LIAGFFHQLCDPVHRAFEVPYLPIAGPWGTVQYLGRAVRVDVELKDCGSLGTKGALVVWAARVPLDVDDVPIDSVDEGAAPHKAMGATAGGPLGILDSELWGSRDGRPEIDAGADQSAESCARACRNRNPQKISARYLHILTPLSEV